MNGFPIILLDIVVSVGVFLVVNALGAKGLPRSYTSFLDVLNEEKTIFNIGYRILAPILFLMVIALCAKALIPKFDYFMLFYSIVFYWVLRLTAWFFHRKQLTTNLLMTLSQAAISIAICGYLFWITTNNPVDNLFPQSSDLSLEFTLISLFVVLQILAQSPIFWRNNDERIFSERCEKQLFAFKNEYCKLLEDRFNQDIALKIILYTIFLVENHFRPPSHRAIERVLANLGFQKMGFIKTTGLMQVKSTQVFSDEESVVASMSIIEEIYDSYLFKSNRFSIKLDSDLNQEFSELVILYSGGYSYNLENMLLALSGDIGMLYGKYSGSYLLDIQQFFECAQKFALSEDFRSECGSIEVDRVWKTRFDGLPACPWFQVEIDSGFCVDAYCRRTLLLRSSRQINLSSFATRLKYAGFHECFYLVIQRFAETIIALDERKVDEKLLLSIEKEFDFEVIGTKTYNSASFLSNFKYSFDLFMSDEFDLDDDGDEEGPEG